MIKSKHYNKHLYYNSSKYPRCEIQFRIFLKNMYIRKMIKNKYHNEHLYYNNNKHTLWDGFSYVFYEKSNIFELITISY